jgi:hypothetical protein
MQVRRADNLATFVYRLCPNPRSFNLLLESRWPSWANTGLALPLIALYDKIRNDPVGNSSFFDVYKNANVKPPLYTLRSLVFSFVVFDNYI